MKERKTRSVAKTISWRLTGTADTIIISYLLTDSLSTAASIGGIELVTKMFLYYIHERTWSKVKWGLKG